MLNRHTALASWHTMKKASTLNKFNFSVSLSQIGHNGCVKYVYTRKRACKTFLAKCGEAFNRPTGGGETPHNTKSDMTKSVQRVKKTAYCQLDSPVAFEASLDLSLARLQAPL